MGRSGYGRGIPGGYPDNFWDTEIVQSAAKFLVEHKKVLIIRAMGMGGREAAMLALAKLAGGKDPVYVLESRAIHRLWEEAGQRLEAQFLCFSPQMLSVNRGRGLLDDAKHMFVNGDLFKSKHANAQDVMKAARKCESLIVDMHNDQGRLNADQFLDSDHLRPWLKHVYTNMDRAGRDRLLG